MSKFTNSEGPGYAQGIVLNDAMMLQLSEVSNVFRTISGDVPSAVMGKLSLVNDELDRAIDAAQAEIRLEMGIIGDAQALNEALAIVGTARTVSEIPGKVREAQASLQEGIVRAKDRMSDFSQASMEQLNAMHRHFYETDAVYRAEMDRIMGESSRTHAMINDATATIYAAAEARGIEIPYAEERDALERQIRAAEAAGNAPEALRLREQYAVLTKDTLGQLHSQYPDLVAPQVWDATNQQVTQGVEQSRDLTVQSENALTNANNRHVATDRASGVAENTASSGMAENSVAAQTTNSSISFGRSLQQTAAITPAGTTVAPDNAALVGFAVVSVGMAETFASAPAATPATPASQLGGVSASV